MTLQDAYSFMYYELLSSNLDVVLVPSKDEDRAKDGAMIRAVVSKNPEWYSDLCAMYPRSGPPSKKKKQRTKIKRIETLRILKILSEGRQCRSKHIPYLQDIAESIRSNSNLSESDIQFFEQFGELPIPFNDQF